MNVLCFNYPDPPENQFEYHGLIREDAVAPEEVQLDQALLVRDKSQLSGGTFYK